MNPYYTIIIPHFNIPQLLRRLLMSIPQRDDVQVIVVDDCSTKHLNELVALRQEFNAVEWYDTGTNGGGGKARNIGLRHAKGKYVLFADADDYFNLCFNQALDKYRNSNSDVIYFAFNSLDSDTFQNTNDAGRIVAPINGCINNNLENVKFFYTTPWAKFIKRELILNNNIWFHETEISNDVYFSTNVDKFASVIEVDRTAIYCWTSRKLSVSRNVSPEKAFIRLIEDNIRRSYLKKKGIKDAHATYLPFVMDIIYNSGNKKIIREALAECRNIGISKSYIHLELLKFRIKRVLINLKNRLIKRAN